MTELDVNVVKARARATMEAVAVLHARGFGRLKLASYVKEGLGAWRYMLVAADAFPEDMRRPNAPSV